MPVDRVRLTVKLHVCAPASKQGRCKPGPCLGSSAPPRKLKTGPPPKRLNLDIFAIGLNIHLTFTSLRRTTFLKPGL